MTPEQLQDFGKSLYGNNWQTALAQALNVSPRTVRHWISGRNHPPKNLLLELKTIARERIEVLESLI